MPAESVPVVAFVIAMFVTFMGVLGFAWLWCAVPPKRTPEAKPEAKQSNSQIKRMA